ncbi:MAG: hypothetical protein IAE79_09985 [Anaerolinea sp.]|nr:hypothetical protein [Anaerolinea sp.]
MNLENFITLVGLLLLFLLTLLIVFLAKHQAETFREVLRQQVAALGGQNIKTRFITPFGVRGFTKCSVRYELDGRRYEHIVLQEMSFWGQTAAVYWNPPLPSPSQTTNEKGNDT